MSARLLEGLALWGRTYLHHGYVVGLQVYDPARCSVWVVSGVAQAPYRWRLTEVATGRVEEHAPGDLADDGWVLQRMPSTQGVARAALRELWGVRESGARMDMLLDELAAALRDYRPHATHSEVP